MVFNLYPERATDAKTLSEYNESISSQNIKYICDYLVNNNITEVWGAWGDDKRIESLKIAKQNLLKVLSDKEIKIWSSVKISDSKFEEFLSSLSYRFKFLT